MKRLLTLSLLAVCASVSAEVFRQVGPDGSVTFSDTSTPGAERVRVEPAQTVTLPPVPTRATETEQSGDGAKKADGSAPAYESFAILEPSNGQGIRANDGSVTVSLSLKPALAPGHKIELVLDGQDDEKVYSGSSLTFNLSQLSRGEHTVSARVNDASGKQLIETGTVSFNVLRVARGGS